MTKHKKTIETDYSQGEYAAWNGLSKDSSPMRGILLNEEMHLVNIVSHPEHLLPGGDGASEEEETEQKPRKAAKKARKKK